jgi:hypothetical protein
VEYQRISGGEVMRELPILFNTEMVQAILDGRKTQTRRVIKLRNGELCDDCEIPADNPGNYVMDFSRHYPKWEPLYCPYGSRGDLLYVRETWALCQTVDHIRRQDGRTFSEISDGFPSYKADGFDSIKDLKEHLLLTGEASMEEVLVDGDKWKPSIHMPKKIARIWLEVKDVRVERLRDIKPEEIKLEGATWKNHLDDGAATTSKGFGTLMDFILLWDKINAKRGYGWDTNPWVWVVEFERVEAP